MLTPQTRVYPTNGLAMHTACSDNQYVRAATLANPSPQRSGLSPRKGSCGSTESADPWGFSLSGAVLRTTAGAASGAARKETATRYGAEVGSPGANPQEPVGLACTSTPGGCEGRNMLVRHSAVESSLVLFSGAGGALLESLYSGSPSPNMGENRDGRTVGAILRFARQCSCGGTIREHGLANDRTAWACPACGRYEAMEPRDAAGEPLPTPNPTAAPQGGLFREARRPGAGTEAA